MGEHVAQSGITESSRAGVVNGLKPSMDSQVRSTHLKGLAFTCLLSYGVAFLRTEFMVWHF